MTRGGIKPGAQRCGAKTLHREDKAPCSLLAGWGTDHPGEGRCKWHGGNTITHRKAAHVTTLKKQAAATYGDRSSANPYEGLLEEVQWSIGHVAWIRLRVREIESGTKLFKPAGKVLLDLYRGERKHLVTVCKVAIDAGLAERAIRLQERQGQIITQAVIAAVDQLGLDDDTRRRLLGGVASELRTWMAERTPIEANVVEAASPPPITPDALQRWATDDDSHTELDDEQHAAWFEQTMQIPRHARIIVNPGVREV